MQSGRLKNTIDLSLSLEFMRFNKNGNFNRQSYHKTILTKRSYIHVLKLKNRGNCMAILNDL